MDVPHYKRSPALPIIFRDFYVTRDKLNILLNFAKLFIAILLQHFHSHTHAGTHELSHIIHMRPTKQTSIHTQHIHTLVEACTYYLQDWCFSVHALGFFQLAHLKIYQVQRTATLRDIACQKYHMSMFESHFFQVTYMGLLKQLKLTLIELFLFFFPE